MTKQTGEREVEFVDKRTGEHRTVTAVRSWWEVAGAERFTVSSLLPLIAPQPVAGSIRSSNDPEPPPLTRVRDAYGDEWTRITEDMGGDGRRDWSSSNPVDDPESWTKVAGNMGPVTLLCWGAGTYETARSTPPA